jgi:hypothetical protein
MVSVIGGPSLNLADAVIHRARTASKLRLSADTIVGVLVAAAALALRPPAWAVIASAGLCFVAFGAWGIADRVLDQPGRWNSPSIVASLLVLQTIAVTIGVIAVLILLFGLAGIAMGTWIS